MNTATELVIMLPKRSKGNGEKKDKKPKDPTAPIEKKPRKKKVKGIFKIEHGLHVVGFD
jgi:hypothetical protein